MKKILKLAAVATLAGLSFSATAWWGGPYGYPHWGGYAPPVVVAPVAPVSQEQLNVASNPRGYGAYGPRGHDPFLSGPGNFTHEPFMPPMYREMFKRSEAERELSLKESQTRREAFRARAAAQRAAMDARRQAWRESVRSSAYTPFGYGVPKVSPAGQPGEVIEAPAAVPTETPAAAPTAAPTAPAPQPIAAAPAPAAQ